MEKKRVSLDRRVEGRMGEGDGVYFVTLYKNGQLEIRPKGGRGESTKVVDVDSIYQDAG